MLGCTGWLKLRRTQDSERVVFAHGSHPAASADAGPSCPGNQTPESLRCRHPGAGHHLFLLGLFFPNVSLTTPLSSPPTRSPYRSWSDVLVSVPRADSETRGQCNGPLGESLETLVGKMKVKTARGGQQGHGIKQVTAMGDWGLIHRKFLSNGIKCKFRVSPPRGEEHSTDSQISPWSLVEAAPGGVNSTPVAFRESPLGRAYSSWKLRRPQKFTCGCSGREHSKSDCVPSPLQ